jgi:hypothetical protein
MCLPFSRFALICYLYELTRIVLSLRVTLLFRFYSLYYLTFLLKNLSASPSRFGFIFIQLISSLVDELFKVFQFCVAFSLALSACFPVRFGTAKVRIFFEFCKKFFFIILRSFQLSFSSFLCPLFNLLAALS